MAKPQGWLKAVPLESYSSINELSLGRLISLKNPLFDKRFYMQFSFNLHTLLDINPLAYLTYETRDASLPPSNDHCCYSITDLTRWRLDIQRYKTLDDFLKDIKSAHRKRYKRCKRIFFSYGCTTEYFEKDWSVHVPQVYKLYSNIADRHGMWLYDLTFFEECAKREDYALLACWYNGEMIAFNLMNKEQTTLHGVCVGFDYNHSSRCFAYSWLNYALIEHAIGSGLFKEVDVGITANMAKSDLGYRPVPARMDIYSKEVITSRVLRTLSRFIPTTINSDGKLKVKFRRQ